MTDTAGYKTRWYRDWFGEEYLSVYAHRNLSDAKKLIDLIIKKMHLPQNGILLDVGCGNARHLKILARKGFRAVGIDLSRVLLESSLIQNRTNFPYIMQADMRHLPFKSMYDAILSLFTSFGYFQSDQMNMQVLKEFSSVLKTGGKVLVDFLNPGFVSENLVPSTEKTSGKLSIKETRWIESGRVYKKIVIDHKKEFLESVRLYTLDEMQTMFRESDMQIEHVFGDYSGTDYLVDSERMIILAVK